jgi:hypothetical protein
MTNQRVMDGLSLTAGMSVEPHPETALCNQQKPKPAPKPHSPELSKHIVILVSILESPRIF